MCHPNQLQIFIIIIIHTVVHLCTSAELSGSLSKITIEATLIHFDNDLLLHQLLLLPTIDLGQN